MLETLFFFFFFLRFKYYISGNWHNCTIEIVFSYFRLSLMASVTKFLITRCKFPRSVFELSLPVAARLAKFVEEKRGLKGVYRCTVLSERVGN